MDIKIELAYDKLDEVIRLFSEYIDSIIAEGQDVIECLNSQQYDAEAFELNEKYGLPNGRIYLAYLDQAIVGCVALRRIDEDFCEMKRLYVKPGNRGKHIGRYLVEQIISDAREIGYKHIRLDTFPFMSSAILLYRRYGFYHVERYNNNPATTAVFMQLDLSSEGHE